MLFTKTLSRWAYSLNIKPSSTRLFFRNAGADLRLQQRPGKWMLSPVAPLAGDDRSLDAAQDQVFSLAPAIGGRMPSGWVSVDARLTCRSWDSKATLRWTTHSGANGGVLYPSMTLKGRIRDLFYLPPDLKELTCSISADAEPDAIVLTEVGLLSRIRRMLYRTTRAFLIHPRARRARAGVTVWRLLTDTYSAYQAASQLRTRTPALPYAQWLEQFDALSERDRIRIRKRCRRLRTTPIITLAVAAGANADDLAATIAALRAQFYPHWELLIVADAGCSANLSLALQEFAALDRRIRVARLPEGNASSTDIFSEAHGSYLGRLDAGDILAEHALYCIAAELEKHPDAVLVYSDEDRLDAAGRRHAPHFKPDWNPQLLLSQNYLDGLCVYRSDAFNGAGTNSDFVRHAETYALNLHITANANGDRIRHIPLLLYHRRFLSETTAINPETGRQALTAHLAAQNIAAEVSNGKIPGSYRVRYTLPPQPPRVSIIIPTRDKAGLLQWCIDSIRKHSTYSRYEIIVVDNQSSAPSALAYLDELSRSGVTVLRYDQPFNYAAINNYAARHCRGEVLCLLNNDTEVITPDWLEEMLGLLYQPDVGVVGAKLYYSDDSIQHAGDLVGVGGIAHHAHAFLPCDNPGYQGRAQLAQDMSAVTGACLMVRKPIYDALGGLDADNLPVAFNDVDFCLRVREGGWRVVWTPWAELYHHESKSRGADDTAEKIARMQQENNFMERRWRHWLEHDPAYNPNLSQERPDFSLSHTPLPQRPW